MIDKHMNPHLDPKYVEQLKENGLYQEQVLTPLQQLIFPALLWLFDSAMNRGTGKSFLMCIVCIELAKRGQPVYLYDASEALHSYRKRINHQAFADKVLTIAKQHYKRDIFEYNHRDNILTYKGRRPR